MTECLTENELLLQHIKNRETDLEKASRYLSELESQLALIFAASPDIIVFLDKEANIIKISDAVYSLLGYKREDVIGKKIWNYISKKQEKEELKTRFKELQKQKIFYPSQNAAVINSWKAKNGNNIKLVWRFAICDEREHHAVAIVSNLICVNCNSHNKLHVTK